MERGGAGLSESGRKKGTNMPSAETLKPLYLPRRGQKPGPRPRFRARFREKRMLFKINLPSPPLLRPLVGETGEGPFRVMSPAPHRLTVCAVPSWEGQKWALARIPCGQPDRIS